jgi:splicing factor 3A subunit 1
MATRFDASASAVKAVQGDVVGLIIPPPELRQIADKAAALVAKHGDAFEQKLLLKDDLASKCSFIRKEDPFHAYYRAQIESIRTGQPLLAPSSSSSGAGVTSASEAPRQVVEQVERSAVRDPIAEARRRVPDLDAEEHQGERGQLVGKAKPPPLDFFLTHPTYLGGRQLGLMRLVAQHVAVSGKPFLDELFAREQGNPVYAFLRPTHPHCEYFRTLTDRYRAVLHPSDGLFERLRTDASGSGDDVLGRCVHRLEVTRREEKKRQEARGAWGGAHAVDWHDFVVVETVHFGRGEELSVLPAAQSLRPGPAPPAMPQIKPVVVQEDSDDDVDMEASEDEEEKEAPAGLEVVEHYQPRVRAAGEAMVGSESSTHFVDPRTGQVLPIGEASEHLRIGLISDQYREDQARAMARKKETAFTSQEGMVDSIQKIAAKRAAEMSEAFPQRKRPGEASDTDPAAKRVKPTIQMVSLVVHVPVDPTYPEWSMDGQKLSVEAIASAPVVALKAQLQPLLGGMPPERMILSVTPEGKAFRDEDVLGDALAGGRSVALSVKELY